MYLHGLHHRLHSLQLCEQLLLGAFHRVGHMIHRRMNAYWCLSLSFLLLQVFLYFCNNITDHVGMMHAHVFNGEIGRLCQLSVRRPENCLKRIDIFCTSGM